MAPTERDLDWTHTPLAVLRRWPAGRSVVMLHSGRVDGPWARWSLVGEPVEAVRCELDADDRPRCLRLDPSGRVVDAGDDPWRAIDAIAGGGVWVGYFGYDLGRCVETLPCVAVDDRGWPAMQWQRLAGWALHDGVTGLWRAGGAWADDPPEIAERAEPVRGVAGFACGELISAVTRERFVADARRAVEYIAAGDVFQVNLAQRLTTGFTGSPRSFYAALAEVSPAWYGAHVELLSFADDEPSRALCSASPELFLQCDEAGRVVTRPIKGTRPAAADAAELRGSAKDAAELAMIVDLLRNDLGRVAAFGSVRVDAPRDLERHPTVQHTAATISAALRRDAGPSGLFRATLPGGSITGAPKVRAMEVIDELEPVRRGPYCGAIGLIHGRSCRLNIAIRTACIEQDADGVGRLDASFGAGVVADSDPESEYDETMLKARAIIAAAARGRRAAAVRGAAL